MLETGVTYRPDFRPGWCLPSWLRRYVCALVRACGVSSLSKDHLHSLALYIRALPPQLGAFANIFVNDAFGAAHRAHASTVGVTKHMEHCVAGFLMEKELTYLKGAVDDPRRPFLAMIGGAKVSTKVNTDTGTWTDLATKLW